MSKYLVSTTETYRVDTESEATRAIEEAKQDGSYVLGKYTSEHKERKSKGEVIDEYELVKATLVFNNEKEPSCSVKIDFKVEDGVFPEVD